MTRRIGAAGIALIEEFEGFSPTWYSDPVGVWTVCFGHTDAAGPPYHKDTRNKVFSKAEGREILARDVQKYADAITKLVEVPLNQNQFDALTSWCYNVGPGAVAKSTLIKRLNAGDYAAVPGELAKWNKAGGKTLKGLTRRRAAEAALWSRPVTGEPSPAPAPQPAPAAKSGPLTAILNFILSMFRR